MAHISFNQFRSILVIVVLSSFVAGCMTSAKSQYFGQTQPPKDNVLRYISGSEPESLDPQIGTGEPDAEIYGDL